jgi:hypothetical protein
LRTTRVFSIYCDGSGCAAEKPRSAFYSFAARWCSRGLAVGCLLVICYWISRSGWGGALLPEALLFLPPTLPPVLMPNLSRRCSFFEEDVPRGGHALTRAYQYVRWTDGSGHVWIARQKGTAGRAGERAALRRPMTDPTISILTHCSRPCTL